MQQPQSTLSVVKPAHWEPQYFRYFRQEKGLGKCCDAIGEMTTGRKLLTLCRRT